MARGAYLRSECWCNQESAHDSLLLSVCECADVTMKCFEICPGDQISKEAFICILALCYVYVMLLFGWFWLLYLAGSACTHMVACCLQWEHGGPDQLHLHNVHDRLLLRKVCTALCCFQCCHLPTSEPVISNAHARDEGFIYEKDYLYLLEYLEDFNFIPKVEIMLHIFSDVLYCGYAKLTILFCLCCLNLDMM